MSREAGHTDAPPLEAEAPRRDGPGGVLSLAAGAGSGIHPLADLLGVERRSSSPDRGELTMEGSALLAESPRSVLAATVGVDLCGSGAIRTRIEPTDRIATTALAVFLSRPLRPGALAFEATVEHCGAADHGGRRRFSASVRIADGAGPVGAGTVAGIAIPGGGNDSGRRPSSAEVAEDLDSLNAVPEGSIVRSLLLGGGGLRPGAEGSLTLELRPLLANRVGDLQGGAAPAIADLLARDLAGEPEAEPRSVFWSFRGPTRRRPRFRVEVSRGDTSAHAAVRMTEGERLRGLGVIDYGLRRN